MLDAIASSVDPPDLSLRFFGGERVEHRHHGRCAHSSAQQNHGILAGTQGKATSRRTNIQYSVYLSTAAQKGTPDPIQFPFDADAQVVGRRQIRQRIAAKDWRFA